MAKTDCRYTEPTPYKNLLLVFAGDEVGRLAAAFLPPVGSTLQYGGHRYKVAAYSFTGDHRGLRAVAELADQEELPADPNPSPGILFINPTG